MSFHKKYVKAFCCLAGAMIFTLNAQATVTGIVNTDGLDVRSKPVQDKANIITQFETDTKVHILDIYGDYYEIEYNEDIAYVYQDSVTFNGITAQVLGDVNLYSEAKIEIENIINVIPKEDEIQILSVGEEFSYVLYDDQYGYVYNGKLLSFNEDDLQSLSYITGIKRATIKVNTLNVRKGATTNSSIISKLYLSEQVDVLNQEGKWLNIRMLDGTIGYIHGDYVSVIMNVQGINTEIEEPSLGQSIADFGLQQVGAPYVYGGTSLTYGVDCSGFTQRVYKEFGVSISRTSRTQFHDGIPVSVSELQEGDLLFYGYNGYISHVALYVGNGQVVHASSPKTGVIVSDMFRSGKPYIGARRILY